MKLSHAMPNTHIDALMYFSAFLLFFICPPFVQLVNPMAVIVHTMLVVVVVVNRAATNIRGDICAIG